MTAAEKAMQDVDAALERYISGERSELRALNDIARVVGRYNMEHIGEANPETAAQGKARGRTDACYARHVLAPGIHQEVPHLHEEAAK
jgi:hypothetical protein